MKLWGTARWFEVRKNPDVIDPYDVEHVMGEAPWYTDYDFRLECNQKWYCGQCGQLFMSVELNPNPGKWYFLRGDCEFHDSALSSGGFPGQVLRSEALTASAPTAILQRELRILAEKNGYLWPREMVTY